MILAPRTTREIQAAAEKALDEEARFLAAANDLTRKLLPITLTSVGNRADIHNDRTAVAQRLMAKGLIDWVQSHSTHCGESLVYRLTEKGLAGSDGKTTLWRRA